MPAGEILDALRASLDSRLAGSAGLPAAEELRPVVEASFRRGSAEAYMDCYHLSRDRWLRAGGSSTSRGG
jgi:hypothetical protein